MKAEFGTIEYWFEYYLKNAGLKPEVARVYRSYFHRHVYPFFYGRQLSSITGMELTSFWSDHYEQGFGNGMASGIYDMLDRFFHFVQEQGARAPSLVRKDIELRNYREEHSPKVLEADIVAIKNCDRYPQAVLILLIAAYCGIKRKEALDLRREDIDLQNCLFVIRNRDPEDNYRAREIKFPEEMKVYFERVLQESYGSVHLFENIQGERLKDADIGHRIRALRRAAGCQEDITYQSFRNYYASMIDAESGNRVAAESVMGICGARVRAWHKPAAEKELRHCSAVLCSCMKELRSGSYDFL